MLFKSHVFTQVSGSIAGTTFSHNRGGLYTRARTVPVNPNTSNQVEVRSGMTAAVGAWMALAEAQRVTWDLYGANTPTTNKLGDEVFLTGQNWYVAAYTVMSQVNGKLGLTLPAFGAGPIIFNRGFFTTPTFDSVAGVGITVTYTDGEEWVDEDEAVMLIWQGRPNSPSRNFFNGPFRLVAAIEGDSITAPTSPELVTAGTLTSLGFPISIDEGQNLAISILRADGRMSTRRLLSKVVTT